MVKTRRSNGENGEVEEGNDTVNAINDVASVSDEKASNSSPRELRSGQFKVTRKISHWHNRQRRRRAIKMSRIVFPESDTEPEKYSKRSRQVRVFFAEDNDSTNRSLRIRRSRTIRKNSLEDSEDKPIQQNVRRSCRKRKLLHHNFNESWITNELKVKGYPDLYGFPNFSSSDEFTSGDEGHAGKKITRNHVPANIDEDTQLSRTRRTSARFTKKKILNACANENSESESDEENNQTVIEKKPKEEKEEARGEGEGEKMDVTEGEGKEDGNEEQEPVQNQDSESNQAPTRTTRGGARRRRRPKKEDSQTASASESSSSESSSEMPLARAPRRSNRTRQAKPAFVQLAPRETRGRASATESSSSESSSEMPLARAPRRSNRTRQAKPAFVQLAPRETRGRAKTFTIRKKPYSLRERKPKILRRKTIRSQSPSTSCSSSSSSSDTEDLNVSMKNKTKGRQKTRSKSTDVKKTDKALRDIQPVQLDGSVRFSSVGGLEEHIKCLREMVLFPLMYPELFQKFKTRPAKGVLFHGPPGTGKTLLARALANECSLVGGRKVSFFMRKGADCLKKWVGESERHLKLLFQQANKMKPSIIFFDEIDALAPVRSVRQEQVHTSVVGTLLAEMDGLCDRGEVVIIGATNRLDAVDPALRRAGRFDRELHFPPPHAAARQDILHIYTKDWTPRLSEDTLEQIAQATSGYGGSDLKALCSEAVLKALRRVYPQVYDSEHALVIDSKNVEVTKADMMEAMRTLVAAGGRSSMLCARRLPAYCASLLHAQVRAAAALARRVAPGTRIGDSSPSVLLISGECAETHIAPAILAELEHCTVKELSVATLNSVHAFTPEQALLSLFSECRRADRGCVLFVRDIVSVWLALSAAVQGGPLLLQLWKTRSAGNNTLLLATTNKPLPDELQELFPPYKECVYHVREPSASEVISFLKPIITEVPLQPVIVENNEPPPPLPIAPPPPPPRESEEDRARRKRKEDYKLRELRIFLRDICRKLASNRRFYKFTKPVDLEEVTDYLDIIKQPMDLETMMTKVDMHKYNCAKEFLDDIDLICANALEYNPDRTSSDKQIRHEACSLRDHAHALIDVEMDSDFELDCQEIARRRAEQGNAADNDLPDFIYTASNLSAIQGPNDTSSKTPRPQQNGEKSEVQSSSKRKRRRINAWSKGMVVKRPKTAPKTYKESSLTITDEESKENKPITSTPLPNGDAMSSSSCSDDDAPLRRPQTDETTLSHAVHNHVLESPTKSTERSPSKASPKKRNSGHEATSESEKVLINKTELDNVLYKNAKALRAIGLEALLDLYDQLDCVVSSYANLHDRTKLPPEMHTIVTRYVQLAKK